MAMDEQGLAQRLQAARRKAGLTQQELCQKANLSYSTLAKIERGAIKSPSIFTIQNIAAAINVTLDELLGTPSASAKATSKSGVRFVYFDINGCLVSFFQGAFVAMATDLGVPADIIETAFWHFNDLVCKGEISVEQFDKDLAERIGVASVDWQKYYFDAIKPISGMNELVGWVASNYQVGLLSNIMPGFLSKMLIDKLLPSVKYDVIIDSSEVGMIKPDPALYQLAIERSGCEPAEILFVDDSRPNIMAAEKAGWHVLWFDGYEPDQSAARVRAALELATEN